NIVTHDIRFSTILFIYSPANTHFSTLSLHDALPILYLVHLVKDGCHHLVTADFSGRLGGLLHIATPRIVLVDGIDARTELTRLRSEEHTSELQSRENLVCRLLLEKKKHIHTKMKTTE